MPILKPNLEMKTTIGAVLEDHPITHNQPNIMSEDELSERVQLWQNLVKPYSSPRFEELVEHETLIAFDEEVTKKQNEYNISDLDLKIWSLIIFVILPSIALMIMMSLIITPIIFEAYQDSMLKELGWGKIIGCFVLNSGIFLLGYTITSASLNIYHVHKAKRLKPLDRIAYLNKNKVTLCNKDKDGRLTAYWKEDPNQPAKPLSTTFKWFNNWEKQNSNLKQLIDCYPELSTLLEKQVHSYPLNAEELTALINQEVSQTMQNDALKSFMLHDNELSTQDLRTLNQAFLLKQHLEQTGLPLGPVHNAVKQYLLEYFKEKHYTELNPKNAKLYIQRVKELLFTNESMPKDMGDRLSELALSTTSDELDQSIRVINAHNYHITRILVANPHITFKYDWNSLSSNLNSIDDFNQYIENCYNVLLQQVTEAVKTNVLG